MCTLGAVKLGSWMIIKTRDPIPTMLYQDHVETIDNDKLVVKNAEGVYCGLNKEGVGIICSATLVDGEVGKDFVGDMILIALQAKTAQEAKAIVESTPMKIQGNYIIADKDEAYAIEYCNGQTAYEKLETNGARANHYLQIPKGIQKKEEYPSTFFRLERMQQMVKKASSLEDLKNALKDHENGPSENSICRHGDTNKTQSAFIIDPLNKALYYCDGHPCESEFTEHTFE